MPRGRFRAAGSVVATVALAAVVASALAPVEQHVAGGVEDGDAVVLFLAVGQRIERLAHCRMGVLDVLWGRFVGQAEQLVKGLLVGHEVQ